jgi:hypothetical protein
MLKAGGKRTGFVRDRHGNPVDHTTATLDQLMQSATCFAGIPDDVYSQIKELNDKVGGFDISYFSAKAVFSITPIRWPISPCSARRLCHNWRAKPEPVKPAVAAAQQA